MKTPFKRSLRRRRPTPANDVEVELTRLLFRRLTGTVLISGIGVVGSTAVIAAQTHDAWLLQLTFYMGSIAAIRIAIVYAFSIRKKPEISRLAARLWSSSYALFTFFASCALAISTVYNFSRHDASAQVLCLIGTFSLCASLSARMGMRPWISQLCGFVVLGALGISVVQIGDLLARTGFVLICFYAYTHWEAVKTKFDIVMEQIRASHSLTAVAEQDALTGLANRRAFEDRLATLCTNCETFGILYMDLDRFKHINDTYGHPIGDLLLQSVANRLNNIIRHDDDLLARLGGDEFAIIQTHIDDDHNPQILARRINQALNTSFELDGRTIRVNVSIGARVASGSFNNPRILLGRADAALYRVKQAGGGNFALAED
jgi:diguanylate cyclase (GGDEF)-like protein